MKECPLGKSDPYGVEHFRYGPENNSYVCQEGKLLTYVAVNPHNRVHMYAATPKRCRDCSQKAQSAPESGTACLRFTFMKGYGSVPETERKAPALNTTGVLVGKSRRCLSNRRTTSDCAASGYAA